MRCTGMRSPAAWQSLARAHPQASTPSPAATPPLQRRWRQPVDAAAHTRVALYSPRVWGRVSVDHAHHNALCQAWLRVTQSQHTQVLVCMRSSHQQHSTAT